MINRKIILKKVRIHNLKSVDLELDANELIVFSGVSGSGKSSLAFDTIYTEGQRRYVESLSTFARRQLGEMAKPEMESASGISPTISIEQKTAGKNPRSTVGTLTEVHDYLRVLYARIGDPHCPVSGERVSPQSRERIIKTVQGLPEKTRLIILSPFAKGKKGEFKEDFQELLRKGFMRARVDGEIVNLSDEITLDGNVAHDIDVVIDRIEVNESNHSRIAESLTAALNLGEGICSVLDAKTEEETLFSMHAFSPKSGLSYSSLEPHDFSFNSPHGMCSRCHGLGQIVEFDLDKVINPDLSISEDCCSVASSYQTVKFGNIYDNLAELYGFDVTAPWKTLPDEAKNVFLYGTKKKWTRMRFVHPVTGIIWMDHIRWRGVLHEAHQRYTEAKSESYRKKMQKLLKEQVCPECRGERLKPYPAATLLKGKKISEINAMTIRECAAFFETLSLSKQELLIADELLKEIQERLHFLIEVGLHYLTLERTAPTLSGGEAQRVRLASQIGCGLVGVTYILDEPSIGLHPRDNLRLIRTLKHLRDIGNTVIVVEHDEETLWEADRIVDIGPGAGDRGGEVLVNGTHKELLECKRSLTAKYLSGELEIQVPAKTRKPSDASISIKGANHHNLKNINVKFPLGVMIAVTGVSGSGKSSLITETLYPALANHLHQAEHPVGAHQKIEGIEEIDKVIAIDQSPIGRNPRSNPATYIKVFDEIRDLFTQLPESLARGYKPGRFSFNVKEGSCTQCGGMGMVKIDMDFMEDAWIECGECRGRRFDPETLSVYFKGKTIYDILEMEVGEALEHFQNIPSIKKKLQTLKQVGMEYIKLGQSSTTLSGGEAQRIKLAKELSRPSTGNTFYILDEPTTGLHFHDIKQLLEVLHALVDKGNTVLVIEHNMDIVKTADWIIDIGPEGGAGGGKVVASGPPQKIAKLPTPTGVAVYAALHPKRKEQVSSALKKAKESGKKRKEREAAATHSITIESAEQNNLKRVSVKIPREKLTVCTGPSGSGKSSLAFDTVYAEGQRRYIESLSPYARQFVKQSPKPKVGKVEGLSPAIAIEQKAHAGNPRSTIGTMTEIYDYLRVLWARIGVPHCPETGEKIRSISKEYVVDQVMSWNEGEKIQVLAPIELRKNEKFEDIVERHQKQGFVRVRLNDHYFPLEDSALLQAFDKKRKNSLLLVIDRLVINSSIRHRLFEAIETASNIGQKKLIIVRKDKDIAFNLAFAVPSTGKSYPEITPHSFAFNTQEGMCHDCTGLGIQYGANLARQKELMLFSTIHLLNTLWQEKGNLEAAHHLEIILKQENIDPYSPLNELSEKQLHLIFNGSPDDVWYDSPYGFRFRWIGINHVLAKAGKSGKSDLRSPLIPLLDEMTCMSCKGSRLNPLARNVTINELSISDFCALPIDQTLLFIKKINISAAESQLMEEVFTQLNHRLRFLNEVGLGYLSLNRKAPTLSGGETQRIRLARQLGSGLTGVLYVLDEPTIGLHPYDNDQLNHALSQLKTLGNTLLMVEHDPQTIQIADYILDFGPKSGEHGGHIIAQGTYKQILRNKHSLSGKYLSGKEAIPLPQKRRTPKKGWLSIKNACAHNLKNLSLEIPIGTLSCLTGVSGSGKSTLLQKVIQPAVEQGLLTHNVVEFPKIGAVKGIDHFDKLIVIDQNPIGHTSRSDVCTYVDVLTRIREFFAALPAAKAKGLMPRHFSYNHRKGMCSNCWGMGYKKVEMHFLPPVRIQCDQCHGLRLNPLSLEVMYKGKNLGQYLEMTVEDARIVFENHPRIARILDTLISVGLGYLRLGQEMASLSGGEAQRIKLSRELAKRSTGKTLYLLDEPTTGLHQDDIQKLLKVLHTLVDKGNTAIVIEHHLDFIKNADYVADLGPGAGASGGDLIFAGSPEGLAACKRSKTAGYLVGLEEVKAPREKLHLS
ncbi:UvrABC system protein A [Waddlia chondrophila 2032/99]|uniref:UvrABC system protein A n=1 Tax=Waddlia chondrophila 2032/99 TaxID=765953 RepID=F8LBE4_9BACT|nr:UvrABC system protein A [Waddlia chondrophila 2032/99]